MLKMFIFAVAIAAVVVVVTADLDADWIIFKTKHKKNYNSEMESIRKHIWSENKKLIEEHNKKFRLGLFSYYLGENEYADMTSSEFVSKMNGLRVDRNCVYGKNNQLHLTSVADTVDWRTKGYVTPVKNQGACGSCWAFSATGAIEGQHFKATGKLVSLSESNLVDCSQSYGNHGCLGGTIDNAFRYVLGNKGIDTESSYPYVDAYSGCHFNSSNIGAIITNYTDIQSGSESALQQKVAEIGPISVGIDASHSSFRLYKGGVYDQPQCNRTVLDHAVLVVGYGTYQDQAYWLVKNSWGTTWGEEGYILMSRNKNNQCGIATAASYPVM